jgi:hypothetical protein
LDFFKKKKKSKERRDGGENAKKHFPGGRYCGKRMKLSNFITTGKRRRLWNLIVSFIPTKSVIFHFPFPRDLQIFLHLVSNKLKPHFCRKKGSKFLFGYCMHETRTQKGVQMCKLANAEGNSEDGNKNGAI